MSYGLNARKSGHTDAKPGSEWAISAAPEDLIYVIHDVKLLVNEVCGDYVGHVMEVLSSFPKEVLDNVKQSVLQSGESLERTTLPVIKTSIIDALVQKSVEDLKQLKGISATYRMTNKPLPVRHCPYVSAILHPLKAFLEGETAIYLDDATKKELLRGTALEITKSYNAMASELVNVARKTESSLQRIRQGAQRRAGASSDVSDHNVSNTDKICMQLFLDIQEYGRNLAALGVDAAEFEDYRSLWQCVAPADKQSTIVF